MTVGLHHPYREAEPTPPAEPVRVGLDAEECFIQGVLALVGVIGVLIGVVYSRSTELVLGGLATTFVVRVVWQEELRPRMRVRRRQ
jgi:hypothetical protein